MHNELLLEILSQLSYLCDRLEIELPYTDPDYSHEINACSRARILGDLIDSYLAGGA